MEIKIRNSQMFVVIVFMASILMLGLAISILMKPVGDVYNMTHNDPDVQDVSYQQFYERSRTVWIWLALPLVLGFIISALIESQREDGY